MQHSYRKSAWQYPVVAAQVQHSCKQVEALKHRMLWAKRISSSQFSMPTLPPQSSTYPTPWNPVPAMRYMGREIHLPALRS